YVRVARARANFALRLGLPRMSFLDIDSARVRLPAGGEEEDSATVDDRDLSGAAAPKVRAAARQVAEALLLPARKLPELRLASLQLDRGDSLLARVDSLRLGRGSGGVQLAARGLFGGDRPIPFDVSLVWHADDRLQGIARFDVPDSSGRS